MYGLKNIGCTGFSSGYGELSLVLVPLLKLPFNETVSKFDELFAVGYAEYKFGVFVVHS